MVVLALIPVQIMQAEQRRDHEDRNDSDTVQDAPEWNAFLASANASGGGIERSVCR
jgi:hypothetical protein